MRTCEPTSPERNALMELAVESWKFSRLFVRVMGRLDAGEKSRYEGQLRWYVKRLGETLEVSGLRLVNIEGEPFDPGIAAAAVNAGDFGPDEPLLIDQMLEPIIMGPSGVLRSGTVILRKA